MVADDEQKEQPEEVETDTTVVKTDMLTALYKYMESKLTYPHGNDTYLIDRKPNPNKPGAVISKRVHDTHVHSPNMEFSLEHGWFHLLGGLLGLHDYSVVNQ